MKPNLTARFFAPAPRGSVKSPLEELSMSDEWMPNLQLKVSRQDFDGRRGKNPSSPDGTLRPLLGQLAGEIRTAGLEQQLPDGASCEN